MRPLRVGLVGLGFIAERGHLPAYLESMRTDRAFSLVAIADGVEARRALAKTLVPSARIYSDHRSLIANERIDVVDVTTPPCDHATIAHAALARGLHVLCEKPLTVAPEDARSLVAHARRAERVIFPCHNYKHAPVVKAVRRVIDEGSIGDVRLVTLQTFRPTHARGVAEFRPDWRRERALAGGGIAMDHGSHTFYLAFDWMRAYPRSIVATTSYSGQWDTEDDVTCTIRFPGGRLASAHLTWRAGIRRVLYTIHGSRGAVRVEDDAIDVVTPEGREAHDIPSDWRDASHARWFRAVLDQLVVAIERREFAGSEAEDALRCIELIDAAYRSADDSSREIVLSGGEVVRPRPRVVASR